jgi:DNA-nicking Smr family endonuclease
MAKQRTPVNGDSGPDDDAATFRAAVRDVKPLAASAPPPGLGRNKAPGRPRRPAPTKPDLDETMPLVAALTAGSGTDTLGDPGAAEGLSFQRSGVRSQVVRRLRRGQIHIEDELDLHGMRQTAAREQLADFLTHSREAGRRCVRIIHGKGTRSGARGPVLKTAVDLWLRRHHDVLAFTSARAIDGGTGALYVLLRA